MSDVVENSPARPHDGDYRVVENNPGRSLLRAWCFLVALSLKRLFWSTSTAVVVAPLATAALFPLRRRIADMSAAAAFDAFSEFLILVFASILVPLCALAYGTGGMGAEREDKTLVYLLASPLPRWTMVLAKWCAATPLTLISVFAALALYCWLAGDVGMTALGLYALPILLVTLAYLGLFHFFAVAFRHATIVAVIYALFIEVLLGNLPGIVKRVAVHYYGRSIMYARGVPQGLEAPDPEWFEPFDPVTAAWTLASIAVVGLVAAIVVFQRREYRDPT